MVAHPLKKLGVFVPPLTNFGGFHTSNKIHWGVWYLRQSILLCIRVCIECIMTKFVRVRGQEMSECPLASPAKTDQTWAVHGRTLAPWGHSGSDGWTVCILYWSPLVALRMMRLNGYRKKISYVMTPEYETLCQNFCTRLNPFSSIPLHEIEFCYLIYPHLYVICNPGI